MANRLWPEVPPVPLVSESIDPPDAQNWLSLLRLSFEAAVQAADPRQRLAHFLPAVPQGQTLVVGAGKAAASMAAAVEALHGHARQARQGFGDRDVR